MTGASEIMTAGVGTSLEDLMRENNYLKQRVIALEEQLNFLGQHRTLARGITGERLVSSLTGGSPTVHTAGSDIVLPSGQTIEVKYAKLSMPMASSPSTLRWQWQKILGETNCKTFDYLLLVGEANPMFAGRYKDPDSPYVLFCVAREEVPPLLVAGTRGAKGILLSSNPGNVGGRAARLYRDFQVTASELETRFGSLKDA